MRTACALHAHAHCLRTASALQIPDLFMKRVEQGGQWSLMCPNECPGLVDSWGEDFERQYEAYEAAGKARSAR
jgi:ribonucleoside-diphosphate reductase alpha chain